MPNHSDRFRFDETRVISEVMDGEIVVVQFETGCYYSIRGTGADICHLLTAGHTAREAVDRLAAHHRLPQEQVAAEFNRFVASLVAERLMIESGETPKGVKIVQLSAARFETPMFEKFDDLADQLLLDPIHEIGEAGWPVRPAA